MEGPGRSTALDASGSHALFQGWLRVLRPAGGPRPGAALLHAPSVDPAYR